MATHSRYFKDGLIRLILVVASVVGANQSAAEEAAVLRFCDATWPPFTYGVENGRITKGVSVEILTEAFKRLNMRFQIDDMPWERCLKKVEAGTYDAVLDANNQSPHFIHGINPTSVYPTAIYVRKDFPDTKLSWEKLRGKKVGLVKGYEYPPSIMDNKAGFIPDKSQDDAAMMRMLKISRYDYVVSDIFSAQPNAQEVGLDIKMLPPILEVDNLYLTFNKSHNAIMKKFDDVFGEMIKEGAVDTIYRKYLPYTYHEAVNLKTENEVIGFSK